MICASVPVANEESCAKTTKPTTTTKQKPFYFQRVSREKGSTHSFGEWSMENRNHLFFDSIYFQSRG